MAKLTVRTDTTPLGRRITEAMVGMGIDDRDLAGATGLSYDTIRTIRRTPKSPSIETATKLADALGCTTDWLIHGKDAGTNPSFNNSTSVAEHIKHLKREIAKAYAELMGEAVEQVNITISITSPAAAREDSKS
jgi:transcriptional regulator with XRE-family HTH domain